MSLPPLPPPPSRRDQDELATVREQRDRAESIAAILEQQNANLLEERQHLRDRTERAHQTLTEIADHCAGDSARVRGKAQGVALALSYLDEWLRANPKGGEL